MVTPRNIKKKFEHYRKWFYTFLATDFLNLPIKEQEKLMVMVRRFLENCEKVHTEAKNIKEHTFLIIVKSIEFKEIKFVVTGYIPELNQNIRIPFSDSPSVGESIECTLFSLDGDAWYSSKEALITKG